MTPDVKRPLYRAAASVVSSLSYAVHVVYYVASAAGAALDQRADVLNARADVDDPELIPQEEEL